MGNLRKAVLGGSLYSILISAFIAHLAGQGLDRGASFKLVFHLTVLAATLGYAVGGLPESIWKGQKWSITLKFAFDGVLYGIATGATFGWLWPAGA